jgi:ligand-binding sensor domain-containing protein
LLNRGVIGSDCVMALLMDKNDNLWIGMDNDGVHRISKKGDVKHFVPDDAVNAVPNTILSMIEDDSGNIWLGSCLVCIDTKSDNCVYCNHDESHRYPAHEDNTARNKIFPLEKDHLNKLWIRTNGAGVYIFDIYSKKIH